MLQVLQVQKPKVSTNRVHAPGLGGLQGCPLSQGYRPAPVSLGSAGAVPMGWEIPRASPVWLHRKLLLAWELPTPGCSGLCRFCGGRTDRACESCWAAAPWGWPLTEPLGGPWAGHRTPALPLTFFFFFSFFFLFRSGSSSFFFFFFLWSESEGVSGEAEAPDEPMLCQC